MKRVQKEKLQPKKRETVELPALEAGTKQPLKTDLDEILDEIDEVLEENAEEFIRAYVQKGGE